METLGQKFKAARERKRLTLSQAAAKTRILVQHLDLMEKDDFSKMPAPAYARGFIRMYAEFLGLDSAPLVQEYTERHMLKGPTPVAAGESETAQPGLPVARIRDAAVGLAKRIMASPWLQRPAVRAGLGVAVLLLLIGLARCGRSAPNDEGDVKPVPRETRQPALAVMREPPEPYIPVTEPAASTP